jgi:hypothetical protein
VRGIGRDQTLEHRSVSSDALFARAFVRIHDDERRRMKR